MKLDKRFIKGFIKFILICTFIIALLFGFLIVYISYSYHETYNVVGYHYNLRKDIKKISPKIGNIDMHKHPAHGIRIGVDVNGDMSEEEINQLIKDVKLIIVKEKNFKKILKESGRPYLFRGLEICLK